MPAKPWWQRAPSIPFGEGLALVPIELAPEALVVLGAILAGYDGLASIHDDGARVVLLTTEAQLETLVRLLEELAHEVPLRFGPPLAYRPAP